MFFYFLLLYFMILTIINKKTFYRRFEMKRPETAMTLIHEIIGDAPFLYEGSFTDGITHAEKLGYDCVEIHASSAD